MKLSICYWNNKDEEKHNSRYGISIYLLDHHPTQRRCPRCSNNRECEYLYNIIEIIFKSMIIETIARRAAHSTQKYEIDFFVGFRILKFNCIDLCGSTHHSPCCYFSMQSVRLFVCELFTCLDFHLSDCVSSFFVEIVM